MSNAQRPTPTISAISTAPGIGGIAVARISGPEAIPIVQKIWRGKDLNRCLTHTAHLGTLYDPATAEDLDTAVATIFRAPRSFTGEDVVELSIHGSRWIQRELINLLIRQGAALAEPGEFTRRALINGKLDLAEAEAVGDMIAASSRAAQRIAISHMRGHYSRHLEQLRQQLLELSALVELELDFSEEDVEFADRQKLIILSLEIQSRVTSLADSFAAGRAIKEGIPVAIVGATNAGKSTLLNSLLGEDKAIVSNIHGTTRDAIEDTIEINGTLFRLTDTAGLRQTSDPIENIGIQRSLQSASRANILLWVIDPQQPVQEIWQTIQPNIHPDTTLIALVNKADLTDTTPTLPPRVNHTLKISALHNTGIQEIKDTLTRCAAITTVPDLTVTNARHYQALTLAAQSIGNAITGLQTNLPGDLLAQDLRETAAHLAAITSPLTTPDLLTHIFSHFCIG
ncbi:MAG: tRNA uridine-5-carboxymethylaminomethyl(34) synthesis GTPase MnmE, partial [Bacteroides sp.]|nr:tRNA uridine-5-carboxymethylaminomethyl(34) synthesis GTPase MnmE [Bacteroides sp.]